MQLKDVMTKVVEVVRPDETLRQAAAKMRSCDVGSLPVCEGTKVLGMLTDRDIVVRAAAEGRDPSATRVDEAMTSEAIFCYDDQGVDDAARMMSDHQVRRLVVLDRQSRLTGIVSLGDLAVDAGDEKMAGKVLSQVSRQVREPSLQGAVTSTPSKITPMKR